MDHKALDRMIDKLEQLIGQRRGFSLGLPPSKHFDTPTEFVGGFTGHDWREAFNLAREIQAGFSNKVRYPSRDAHQAAWNRFNSLRSEAHERSAKEREKFRYMSEYFRDQILAEAKRARFDPLTDIVIPFGQTDVAAMKQLGSVLKNAGGMLSEHKHSMLAEHKSQCFDAITEARASHDIFWSRYKDAKAERRRNWESKRREIRAKIEDNISKNRGKLERIRDAIRRNEDRIEEIKYKLSDTTSEKWIDIFGEWLSEAYDKKASLNEAETRVEGWIREEEERLTNLA